MFFQPNRPEQNRRLTEKNYIFVEAFMYDGD